MPFPCPAQYDDRDADMPAREVLERLGYDSGMHLDLAEQVTFYLQAEPDATDEQIREAVEAYLTDGVCSPDDEPEPYHPAPGSRIRVMWCGEPRDATVVRWFKNGKCRVQIGRDRWTGGRPGSSTDAPRVTVEAWQVIR